MHWKPLILFVILVISVGMVFSPISFSFSQGQSPSIISAPESAVQSSNLTVEWNGTIVVSGNAEISGGQMASFYDGHGALYVSGNFIIQNKGVLHINNLSIVFIENSSFINNGRLYSNDSMITVYDLSPGGIPDVTFMNYGYMMGNNTSLEFPGSFLSSSSTVILDGGYFGYKQFSFSSSIVGSVVVLNNEKVYGNEMLGTSDSLGYGNLVSLNITRSTLYAYNTFFNLAPPKTVKQTVAGNKTNNATSSYSSTTGKYSGGYINMASSSAYYLNFSMNFNSTLYGTSGYTFPIFGDTVSSSYFFDSDIVTVASSSGAPIYNLPFAMKEDYSSYATSMNSVFRNITYTHDYAPFPSTLGPSSAVYGLVDVYNGSGLFTFNYYDLTAAGKNYTILYPALPLFEGDPADIIANVPSVYFQMGPLNLTYSVKSTVSLNYSGLYGNINGQVSVDLGGVSVYSGRLSLVAGHSGVLHFTVDPLMPPGDYWMNVTMSESSEFSYNPLSLPVVVYQDMQLNLSVAPVYTMIGSAPNFTTFANVTVSVSAAGNFNSSYGEMYLAIYNGSMYLNYSDYLSLQPGGRVSLSYPVPTAMLLSHQINYTLSVYPGLSYERETAYTSHLNQSLLASFSKVKYTVKDTGVNSASLNLDFSVSSLTAESNYSVYLNGVVKASGYATPGLINASIPIVIGKNHVVIELNGEAYGTGGNTSSWNTTFYLYPVSFTGSIPPYMTAGYPPLIHMNISAVGAPTSSTLSVYLNGTEVPYNGTSLSVRAVSSTNVVTVYENVLGFEVLVANTTFSSTVVYPPPFSPTGVTSLVGISHASVSFVVPSNVSLTNVTMTGVGSAYNHSIRNGIETFNFYTNFTAAGTADRVFIVNGTVHGLPFSTDITVPIKVGYPSFSVSYVGKHTVEYGTKSVELKEKNLNYTGTFDVLTVVVSSGTFSRTYTLSPNTEGIVSVPLPARFGIYGYTLTVTYDTGFTHSVMTMKNVVTVSPVALPGWAFESISAVLAAIVGTFLYRRLSRNRAVTKAERTVKCGECKRDVPFDADKCPYCGTKFSERMYCEVCGADIPRASDYCPECGNVFNKNLQLAEMLKGEYRKYVGEKRKELEKVLGKIQDAEFWRMIVQGNKTMNIERFETFRTKYMVSGSFSEVGVTVCPVCGSGIVLTEDRCSNCGVSMDMVMDYFARMNNLADMGHRPAKVPKERKRKKKEE